MSSALLSMSSPRPVQPTLQTRTSRPCAWARPCRAQASAGVDSAAGTQTEQIFREIAARESRNTQAGGAGGGTTYEALKGADGAWRNLRNAPTGAAAGPAPVFVTEAQTPLDKAVDYDVAVCGGTLGIFLACALQVKGLKVAVLERGELRGREQEWNISRKEMAELVAAGVLTDAEVEDCIAGEFNPVRIGFKGGKDVWTRDVLNLGVKPSMLIDKVSRRFQAGGGVILDRTLASGVTIHPDGASIALASGAGGGSSEGGAVTAALLVDAMGHASPIVRQIRHGEKPEGVCLVVGTLSRGFDAAANTTSDVIYTNSDIEVSGADANGGRVQYFWEAFPAGSGPQDRTSYMFAYMDADPRRPSLEELLEDYWKLMPEYQGVDLSDLEVQRILFGFFPTYRASPLPAAFDRVLQVGDASGIQSPLSFGGFGALSRHMHRLTAAITDAVQIGAVDRDSLSLINRYNPGLSSAWMLQRAMSVRPGEDVSPDLINKLLSANFAAMQAEGDAVMKPFLQDVIQFTPLAKTMLGQMTRDPLFVPQIFQHVGLPAIFDWTRHFITLGAYSAAYRITQTQALQSRTENMSPQELFKHKRFVDSLEYGSGRDYVL